MAEIGPIPTPITDRTPKTGQRSNGFKKRDLSALVGSVYGRLTIAGPSAKPGRVLCKCDCGENAEPKIADVLNGRTTSCGCAKAENFKGYWDRKAQRLPSAIRRAVFNRAHYGLGKAAETLSMSMELVIACGRVHGRCLLAEYGKFFNGDQYPRHHHPDICDLSHAEFRFLMRHARRDDETLNLDDLLDERDMAWAVNAGIFTEPDVDSDFDLPLAA